MSKQFVRLAIFAATIKRYVDTLSIAVSQWVLY